MKMFKKLKTRLMLLNLAVGGVILVIIAVMAYVLISSNIKDQSMQAFEVVINDVATQNNNQTVTMSMSVKSEDKMVVSVTAYPYYIIGIDSNGRLLTDMNLPMPENTVDQIIQNVLKTKAEVQNNISVMPGEKDEQTTIAITGPSNSVDVSATSFTTISDDIIKTGVSSYRYAAVYTTDSTQIIMQDLNEQTTLLTNVGIILMLCVAGGLLLLALGGRFLAERSIRPIRASWQKQRDFVADASHELRTPLAAIISNIEVILDDPHTTVQEKQLYCQGIAQESKRMTQLVDGLLLLARADSNALVFQNKPVDLASLTQEATAFMQPEAAGKGTTLSLQINQAPVVAGDADRLKQVLLQLINNAIKYTPEGGNVELTVDSIRDKAVITVCDNGIGIAKDDLDKIFERFYRADASREYEDGGHGLGLAIAKYIVEQHKGSISAASRIAQGTTFTIILPIARENLT